MHVDSFAACDIGLGRETNEDRFLVDHQLNMLAVSDGMGGHAAGEVAATRSLEIAADYLRSRGPIEKIAHAAPDGYFRVLQLAEDALEEASRQIYQQASSEIDHAGMGATLTMLLVIDDKAIIAHVGDSRLYLMRDRRLHLLTNDHTMAEEFYQAGQLSRQQADQSRYANILTRAIGTQPAVQVETLLFDLLPSDICLLCSDGLSNYFDDPSEVVRLLSDEDLEDVDDYLAGQSVIAEGDACEGLYVVLSGSFSLTSVDGSEQRLAQGDCYGADSLFNKRPSPATIVANCAGMMMHLSGPDFERLSRRQPKLGGHLLRRLCRHLSEELHKKSDDIDLSDTVDF